MPSEFLIAAGVAGFVALWIRHGGGAAALAAMIAGAALAPVTVAVFGVATVNSAMAAPTPTLTSYHLAIAGALIALPLQTFKGVPALLSVFFASLLMFAVVRGEFELHTMSGLLQWGTAILGWGVGAAVAQVLFSRSDASARLVAIIIDVAIFWHAAIVMLQVTGLRTVGSVALNGEELSRASGLAGASGNLGKIIFCLILLLLPLTVSSDKAARRLAIAGIGVGALITGLSYSRANAVAVALALVLWLLLGPGLTLAKRIVIPVAAAALAFPIIDILILRSEYDPDGGSRPLLTETALHQISETLWFGVGPNNYLNYVGQYDAYAAGGLPVHSAFLLALAEIGLASMILLLGVLITVVVSALKSAFKPGPAQPFALALVVGSPGVFLISTTGWGLLRGQFLVLLLFTIGMLYAGVLTLKRGRAGARGHRGFRTPTIAIPERSA